MAETAAGEELMRKQHRDPPASAGITFDILPRLKAGEDVKPEPGKRAVHSPGRTVACLARAGFRPRVDDT